LFAGSARASSLIWVVNCSNHAALAHACFRQRLVREFGPGAKRGAPQRFSLEAPAHCDVRKQQQLGGRRQRVLPRKNSSHVGVSNGAQILFPVEAAR
jgi:hypothetical protein